MKKEFALKLFEAFSIERWNDLARPFALTEMDKQAERTLCAYIIGKYQEARGDVIDWTRIIYASLFDLLLKISLCDIKSPVRRLIKEEHPAEWQKLCQWVFDGYKDLIDDEELLAMFRSYLASDGSWESSTTGRVFRAAHKYATYRELEMISLVNEKQRLKSIREQLEEEIKGFCDLEGLRLLMEAQKPFQLLLKIEQLRFQTRWNQTPRVPKTSVLGHSFFVAVLTLLLCRQAGVAMGQGRLYCDFFCALFHDLPESVTRDIISPVKRATRGMPAIVKEIEDKIVAKELLPYMEDFYKDEVLYFTQNEFENRCVVAAQVRIVSFDELNAHFAQDKFHPTDGKLVRVADHYSALLEASLSIAHGITSDQLEAGKANLQASYPEGCIINGVDAGTLFAMFR